MGGHEEGHSGVCGQVSNFQQVKFEYQRRVGLLQRIPIAKWKWEMITMDLVVGLPMTFDTLKLQLPKEV